MNRALKAMAAIVLMMTVVFAACNKQEDPNNVNGATVIPTVETSPVHDITETKATGGGVVTSDGGGSIIERGLCWSTDTNPIVSGNHAIAGTGAGTFFCDVNDLEPSTTYYVRAYAINNMGVGYGNQISFTTMSGSGGGINAPEGAIGGIYSVSASQKVYFSKGNLQYQASTNTWRFAEKQYYAIGEDNHNISDSYSGWIDLFGWGTSGYNHGAICYQPWRTDNPVLNNISDPPNFHIGYHAYGRGDFNLYDETGRADWGYNAISNGGNQCGLWRTLSKTEWSFLLNTRYTSSGIRFAKAQVNGVNGIILVPDDWNVTTFNLSDTNNGGAFYTSNIVGEGVWNCVFEPSGAIFLPAAGYRSENTYHANNSNGYYWTSSYWYHIYTYDHYYGKEYNWAYMMIVRDVSLSDDYRSHGFSVRLVCSVE